LNRGLFRLPRLDHLKTPIATSFYLLLCHLQRAHEHTLQARTEPGSSRGHFMSNV
jgi:hypothetical protein